MAEPIDILLADIKMPGHDGFWLVELVRARWPQTAIIMATGVAQPETLKKVQLLGVVDYLTKPYGAGAAASGDRSSRAMVEGVRRSGTRHRVGQNTAAILARAIPDSRSRCHRFAVRQSATTITPNPTMPTVRRKTVRMAVGRYKLERNDDEAERRGVGHRAPAQNPHRDRKECSVGEFDAVGGNSARIAFSS